MTEELLLIQTESVSTFVPSMDIAEMGHFIRLAMTAVVVNQVISLNSYDKGGQIYHTRLHVYQI